MRVDAIDVIVIGAGSAGCALAARLSENPDRSVLVLEAGRLYKSLDDFPVELRLANSHDATLPGHRDSWSFTGQLTADRSCSVPRGKVVGGSSAINGTQFVRGTSADFDSWAAAGNHGWSYGDVLPYYVKSERDLDVDGELHGTSGPIPVRREAAAEMTPVTRAFVRACTDAGFRPVHDKNAAVTEGVGPLPLNNLNGIRMNAALGYLLPCLGRPNLTVRPQIVVTRIRFKGRTAVGVEVDDAGRRSIFHAAEIVLCAGAIKSPQILMLSGVGPADTLSRHGIPVIHDSPFVGRNFMDDPIVLVPFRLAPQPLPAPDRPLFQAVLNYAATAPDSVGDIEIKPAASAAAAASTAVVDQSRPRTDDALFLVCTLHGEASRGEIKIVSPDYRAAPGIHYRYLSEASDRAALREAIRSAATILGHDSFREMGTEITTPAQRAIDSDAALDRWLDTNLATAAHMSSSCRMTPSSDPTGVVDQHCRVHGVDGLRVVDASIMPRAVSRGPAATALMIGERAAAFFD